MYSMRNTVTQTSKYFCVLSDMVHRDNRGLDYTKRAVLKPGAIAKANWKIAQIVFWISFFTILKLCVLLH